MACQLQLPSGTGRRLAGSTPQPQLFRQTPARKTRASAAKALDSSEQHAQQHQQMTEPAPPAAPSALKRGGPPVWILAPGLLIVVAGGARAVKAYLRRKKGSMGELESRGHLDAERGNTDPYLNDAMKNVNTINYEPLSKEQIEAARKRRLRERDEDDMDIEKVELPENHPWAVKQQVTRDEEELQKARLTIRRGAPLQDLSGKRGFPEDPRSQPVSPPTEQALR